MCDHSRSFMRGSSPNLRLACWVKALACTKILLLSWWFPQWYGVFSCPTAKSAYLRTSSTHIVWKKRTVIFSVMHTHFMDVFRVFVSFLWILNVQIFSILFDKAVIRDNPFDVLFLGQQCRLCKHHPRGGCAVSSGSAQRRWCHHFGPEKERWWGCRDRSLFYSISCDQMSNHILNLLII